jgi:hypothetical protein
MIAGTIVIEDFTLHFTALQGTEIDGANPLQVRYTVCDNLSGAQETVQCSFEAFSMLLAIAMASENVLTSLIELDTYEIALKQAMPKARALRWVP